MKRTALFLVIVLLISTCFALAACGNSTDDSSAPSADASADASVAASEPASAETSEETSEEPSEDPAETSEPAAAVELPAGATVLFVSHYEDNMKEGAGSIFTGNDNAGVWWNHFAFKPVDAANGIYEVVATSVGVGTGEGAALAIPEDGFVYAINKGNDWPTLVAQNPGQYPDYVNDPNYTSANCDASIASTAADWKVGVKVQFFNLNLDSMEIPTSTPDTPWYDPAYVSTAGYLIVQ